MTRRLILIVVLIVGLAAPAWAGFDNGMAAYERGDYENALREWQPLAEQGDAAAQYNLGIMYAKGQGVAVDDPEAMRLYRKAANQGSPPAQYDLGLMYARGQGVPTSHVLAHMWANLAAGKGHKQALKLRGDAEKRMTPSQFAEAQKLASGWQPQK
jgi:hypothetical protein